MDTNTFVVARAGAVAAAVLAAVVVWVGIDPIAGVDLQAPVPGEEGATHHVGLVAVMIPSAVASLAGWALLGALERLTARPRVIWTTAALVVLVLSLGGPLSAAGLSTLNQIALALMHVAVAAVLVPLLGRTARRGRRDGRTA